MKAIEVKSPGGPESLVLADAPLPAVGAQDVLIKVAAAGVNRADVLQRKGMYPPPPGAPPQLGLEVSGFVQEVGPAVQEFKVGDAVCALLQGGGYAEYVSVHHGQVLRVPRGVELVTAAALPEAYFTVWSNVFERGRLQPGERFLVHGGSSGIGSAAIQLAAVRGATVFTTVGSDEKARYCRGLGAAQVINYRSEDFVSRIHEWTQRQGVHVILDMVGGEYLSRNVEALAIEGRLVMIASMAGAKATLHIGNVMRKRVYITGSTLRSRSVDYKQELKSQLLQHVWPLLESGQLRPTVHRVFKLQEASAAHALMESSAHMGKILLTP